ncbi:ferroxidase fet3 [Coemansia sp. BCRC 34301]|nr:ferroxidase fet3 [Coemansia sp. BCRC 34301]
MKWSSANSKLSISVHLHTPQIAITPGSNNNMLLGYLNVNADRPVSVKSIKVSFSGVYSAFWVEGSGQNRLEYYQNKEFIAEYLSLTKQHLVDEAKRGGMVVARAAGEFLRDPYGTGAVPVPEWNEAPTLSRSSSRSDYDDDAADQIQWGNDNSAMATAPPPPFDYTGAAYDDGKPGFELPAGKHRFGFAIMLPTKMPSTVVSKVGGIEYTLNACMRTKSSLGMSGYLRAHQPVHVVNMPPRLAQTALPVNDEAVFTKQIDDGWWVMAKLATRTASPGDALQITACLSWPGKCAYDADISEHLELVATEIQMSEVTVYRSLATGAVLKRIVVPVASTSATSARTSGSLSTDMDVVHSAVSESAGLKMAAAYEQRTAVPGHGALLSPLPPAARGLFNEDHSHEYELVLPGARDTGVKPCGEGPGILIDSRSAPVSVTHEVIVKIKVLDKCAQKLHTIPFKSRVVVVPEAEAFFLPAYSASTQDWLAVAVAAARVEYDMEIATIMTTMDGVHERMAVVVNGEIPMPLVRANLGDTLALRIRNGLKDEATGLHSHGLFNNGTNYYDGAGMVTECGIAPGSEMTYEILLTQTGTYWLHGHHNSQYINGLRGPLIITDPEGEPYDYDEDLVITFEDWFPTASNMTMDPVVKKKGKPVHHSPRSKPPPANTSSAASSAMAPIETHTRDMDMGCQGKNCTTAAAAATPATSSSHKDPAKKYPIGVINGRDGTKAPELYFEPNKTYRLRLLNIGSTFMFRFGIEGHDMHVIEVDGVATDKQQVNSVLLGVAQRVSVLVTARPEMTNNYRYHFDIFSDVFPEVAGYNPRSYSGSVIYDENAEYATATSPIVWEDFDDLGLVPLDRLPIMEADVIHDVKVRAERASTGMVHAYINDVSFELPTLPSLFTALSFNYTDSAMNGTVFGEKCNARVIQHMDVAELRVANYDTVHHPMHLHGQFFQIVERGVIGNASSAVKSSGTPMRRDTTLVAPGAYAILRFRADNPGVWLMHCHIDLHMELGLSMMFVSAPEIIRQTINVPDVVLEQCRLLGIPISL